MRKLTTERTIRTAATMRKGMRKPTTESRRKDISKRLENNGIQRYAGRKENHDNP